KFRNVHRHERLEHKREKRGDHDGAGAELVNLDVRFRKPQIEGVVHHVFTAAVPPTLLPAASAAGAGGSFFSNGCRVSSTITSSSRCRFADGRTRTCWNGRPVLISVTMPTGKSRGKMRSIPLVTTCSPTFTVSSVG